MRNMTRGRSASNRAEQATVVGACGPAGALRAQQDNMPQGGSLPTSGWQPGEHVTDQYRITIPTGAPAGAYTLHAGMYYLPSGDRLPVRDGREAPGDSLTLTSVQVVAP